jgi:predicted enzyme related to lactoylglutathione lyase
VQLQKIEVNQGYPIAMFPTEGGVGGAIIAGKGYVPSEHGSVLYLSGGEDLEEILGRVEEAGVKIQMPKTSIGEHGFITFFIDTEGNKVGLHSLK